MLLKGLEEHDAQLRELLSDNNHERQDVVLPVVLWTDHKKQNAKPADEDRPSDDNGGEPRQFVSIEQLREELGVAATALRLVPRRVMATMTTTTVVVWMGRGVS